MSVPPPGLSTCRALVTAALPLLLLGCGRITPRPAQVPRTAAAAAADTARGIVQSVGTAPNVALVLAPVPGTSGATLVLTGPDSSRLQTLTGLEVMVAGVRTEAAVGVMPRPTAALAVTHFFVRGANGVAAVDGVIARDGDRFSLITPDGARFEVPHLPPALRPRVGVRVFLVGPLGAAPLAYGVIGER